VRGSDRVVHYGHISKQGSAWLRWVLCQAAQTAKRSPQLAAGYQAIAQRRGKKIATTAVASKLLTPRLAPAHRRRAHYNPSTCHNSRGPGGQAVTSRRVARPRASP
jgi:transposase